MQEATVVNAHNSKYDVLIDRTTIFGNPFKIGQHGTREQVIRKFQTYFYKRIDRDPAWKAEVLKLRGKILGCHCDPLPCHGWVYADYVNSYDLLERYRILPVLEKLIVDVNCLAAEHGWYPPELEGYMRDALSEIDHPDIQNIINKAEEDENYDTINAIMDYVKDT